ncbi:DEAD/DEAH box helicase [Sporichthya brevicatena]|uniref:DEAD/DEAH box helicase n=1 Tax=Sporichthya brevicatena TaxID=171442 RepID=A0ABP3S7T0_9ACTN
MTVQDEFRAAPGSIVQVRDEEWLVTEVVRDGDGWVVHCQGLTELVRDTSAIFATVLDEVVVLDPADATVVADTSPSYTRSRLWLEAMLRKSPVPLTDPELSVATRGLSDALGYQQEAVRKALDPSNLRPRILLADAVGLGKTIEIGMILAELVRRGRGERILVVTPRHVLEQMQGELWNRFALPFVRLDSTGIQRIRQKLPANRNPFTYYKRVIISIDTLKADRYLAHLQKQRWDAVVIDESHNVTNAAAQNNRLARLLAARTDALILASATPHNGKKESFAELVRMLDPSAVRPDGELVESEVQRLVIRRHRHSPEVAQVVGSDWAERLEPRNILVDASPAENAVAEELEQVWLHPESGRSPYSGSNAALFPWTLAKAFLSSPAALRETIKERTRRLAKDPDPAAEREIAALANLDALAAKADGSSAKYDRLVQYLREIGVGPGESMRAVVFAERVPTLKWLTAALRKDLKLGAESVVLMHGGLTDDEQQRIVDSFKQSSSAIRVLVTGDVASEGVNLHSQCHHLIHFDIPWSLIRIEQRNGRIDRYGQKHRPQITTLLLHPTTERFAGDIRVLTKLVDKEHEAHTALGDVASLMGKYDVDAEEDVIRKVLAGQAKLDDEIAPVETVAAQPTVAGIMARLKSAAAAAPAAPPPTAPIGIFPTELDFLRTALHAFMPTPAATGENGVGWQEHTGHAVAQFAPPADLRQRLEVLPQTYLAERRVMTELKLATSVQRGRTSLAEALADDSPSSWPEAHYLAPLHPVLEWAADRALAHLNRNEVFAVRSDTDDIVVLLQGMLTNARGHVVAANALLARFPNPENLDFVLVEPHARAVDGLAAAGFTGAPVNAADLTDVHVLTRFIAPAVRDADKHLETLVVEADRATRERVQQWIDRTAGWEDDAAGLTQRQELKERRRAVADERQLATAMLPERRLVRPLLVVVPKGLDLDTLTARAGQDGGA